MSVPSKKGIKQGSTPQGPAPPKAVGKQIVGKNGSRTTDFGSQNAKRVRGSRNKNAIRNPQNINTEISKSVNTKKKIEPELSTQTMVQHQTSLNKFKIPKRRKVNDDSNNAASTSSTEVSRSLDKPLVLSKPSTNYDRSSEDIDANIEDESNREKRRKCKHTYSSATKQSASTKNAKQHDKTVESGEYCGNSSEIDKTLAKSSETRDSVIGKDKDRQFKRARRTRPTGPSLYSEFPSVSKIGNTQNDVDRISSSSQKNEFAVQNAFDSNFMDVDFDFDESSTPGNLLALVLDTNVWVANTDLIDEVLRTDFSAMSGDSIQVTIIIPWMVLQEIDHVIHRKADNDNFRNAAKYIHQLLSSKHPRVKGQKATEAIIGIEFNELMADDSILNCAIQCAKQPNMKAVFVTNDINLLNKALVHDIPSFKADNSLLKKLQEVCSGIELTDPQPPFRFSTQIPNNFAFGNISNSLTKPASESLSRDDTMQEAVTDMDESMEIDDPDPVFGISGVESANESVCTNSSSQVESDPITFETVISSVQKALTNVIVLRMVEEYGQDGWKFAIKIKPPFTVETALKCVQAHWIAVFSFIFSSRAKLALDELLSLFKTKPVNQTEADVIQWRLKVCEMTYALLSMVDKADTRPRIVESSTLLQKYIQGVKKAE